MFLKLSDPSHAEAYKSMLPSLTGVLAELRQLPWASNLFGNWTHTAFVIRLADSKESAVVSLEQIQGSEMLMIGSAIKFGDDWGAGIENGNWVLKGRWEYVEPTNAAKVVDRIIQSILQQVAHSQQGFS